MFRQLLSSTWLAVVFFSASLRAQSTETQAEKLAALQTELARQRAELEQLKAEEPATPAATGTNLRLTGYAQVDWVIDNQASKNEVSSSGTPLNENRFTLRRAHLRTEADRGLLEAAIEIDANTINGLQLRPLNVEAGIHWPETPSDRVPTIGLSAGLMKIPFGFEVPERDSLRPFLERSNVMRALYPGLYDIGARLYGRYRSVELVVALMNGHPLGDRVFPALSPTSGKDVVGRLGVKSELVARFTVEFGVSGNGGTGFHRGTPATQDQLVWNDTNADGIFQPDEVQVVPGSAAGASKTFSRFALGADARVRFEFPVLGELTLRGEIVRGKNIDRGLEPADPIAAGYDFRELGWYLGFTQEITQYGMLGVRFDRYDPDQDEHEQAALSQVPVYRTYRTLALMAMLRYDTGRLTLEYDKNDDVLEHTTDGTADTRKNDVLTLRGQVAF